MKKAFLTAIGAFVLLAGCAYAAIPDVQLFVKVHDPYPQKFDFSVRAGNTPLISVYCITGNIASTESVAYTNFGTEWTPEFNYFLDDTASSGVTISGTLDADTGIISFQAATNTFPAAGKYFGEVYLEQSTGEKLTLMQGQLTVTRSPSSGGIGSLNLSNRINWDIIENVGTPPWAEGAEPIFLASEAYKITGTMTSQWTYAYTNFGPRIAALETGRVTLASYNAFTNAQFNTNTALQSQISTLTNLVGTGTVTLASFNATNALFEARIGSNETFRTTTQPAINTALQLQITNNLASQTSTNALFESRITSNEIFRTAQGNTNTGFQELFDAQANTNAGYEVRITSNETAIADLVATDVVFQAAFDAQANTNTALQLQITNNLAAQTDTNAAFEVRIGSNETFRITTQPATNAALLTLITNNAAAQLVTNEALIARIASNETFRLVTQPTTNAEFAGRIAALEAGGGGGSSTSWPTSRRIDEWTVANFNSLGPNIGSLTNTTYTGSLSTVTYVGTAPIVESRVYAWGLNKGNYFGSATLSAGGTSVVITAGGWTTNHFVALNSETEFSLTLTGDGNSKSDASGVFLKEVLVGPLAAVNLRTETAEINNLRLPGTNFGYVWTLYDTATGAGAWADPSSILVSTNSGWIIPYSNAWGAGWMDYGLGYTNEGSPLLYAEHDIITEIFGQHLLYSWGGIATSSVANCDFALPGGVIQGLEIRIDQGARTLDTLILTGHFYCVAGVVTSDVSSFTYLIDGKWHTNTLGGSTNLFGLTQENLDGQTSITACVYYEAEDEGGGSSIALDAISLRVHYQTEKGFSIDAQGRFAIVDTNDAVRYPLIELDTLSNQVAAIEGTDTNSFIAVSNQVAVIETNYFPLQSGLSVSNDMEIVKTNYVALPDYNAHISNETADIQHLTAAEKAIATNQSSFQTNQIIVVDGTAYTITNAPASAGDVLVFDPATTTAYFSAQAGGGLTLDDVKNVAPLMTNSDNVAIGINANGNSSGAAVGRGANADTYGSALGYDSKGYSYGAAAGRSADGSSSGSALGYAANGITFGVAVGRNAKGRLYGVAVGYAAYAPNHAAALGYLSWATNFSVALGQGVTNTITNTTRVRGDLYLDGGTKIYTRETFNSGSFSEYGNSPFQEFSSSVEAVDGTATVVYASGNLVRIEATNDTEITFDNTDFPTNGVNRVWIELLAGAHTITFNEATITNAVAPTPSTENWTSLEFRRTTTNLWRGVQY